MLELNTAKKQSTDEDRHIGEGSTQIRLFQHERHWNSGDQKRFDDVTKRDFPPCQVREVFGQRQDQDDLDPFRRLEMLTSGQPDPSLGAQYPRAKGGYSQERKN